MKILYLDLGGRIGWAWGESGVVPDSGSFDVGQDGLAAGKLGRWLRDHRREHGLPDLYGVEKFLNPRMQKHYRVIESSIRLNGATHAIAGVYGVPLAEVNVDTIRATVCGRARADLGRAPKTKNEQRMATKRMVMDTMVMLKLLPHGLRDYDRSDAVCGWRYCESVYGRCAPSEFQLT